MVKGKSMVTEELGLNRALMDKGIEVNETDLGEYIIQLAGKNPLTLLPRPSIKPVKRLAGSLQKNWVLPTPMIPPL